MTTSHRSLTVSYRSLGIAAGMTAACLIWAATGARSTSQSSDATTSSHHDLRRRHGTLVRADGRDAGAQGQVVGERLPVGTELRRGLHQRRRLRGDVRGRHRARHRALRVVQVRHAHRPRFATDLHRRIRTVGGVIATYPFVTQGWSGDNLGDALVGVKINLLSEEQQKPVALALRGMVKLPTGDKTAGVSTGKADGFLDLVLSKDVGAESRGRRLRRARS